MDSNRILATIFLFVALGVAAVGFWNYKEEPGLDPATSTQTVAVEPGGLLLFTQEGCPPCRQLESMLHSDTVSAFFKQTGVSITEVNTRKHQDLVRKYHVSVTPTLVLLDNQAKERARKEGAMDATTFMDWVRSKRP